MLEQAKFKCLRCNREYRAPFDPQAEPQERTCPRCRSNSVRRLKEKDAQGKSRAPGGGEK